MMAPTEFADMIRRLRKGEGVICPLCKKGKLVTVGDYRTSPGFHCDNCKGKLNLN